MTVTRGVVAAVWLDHRGLADESEDRWVLEGCPDDGPALGSGEPALYPVVAPVRGGLVAAWTANAGAADSTIRVARR